MSHLKKIMILIIDKMIFLKLQITCILKMDYNFTTGFVEVNCSKEFDS